ncbi:MAG TPA: hypothetical protein VFL54_07720 [Gammaproteobacteria bacterium]|nr:hypothetical protein [Gammaproteobacteria bacterium]
MPLDLVSEWLAHLKNRGESPQMGLIRLQASTGTQYDMNRLHQWRRGERTIPQPVQAFMRREVLFSAIRNERGTPPASPEGIQRLALRLEPPKRKR